MTKKILSLMLALALVLGATMPAMAIGDDTTNTVTLHKLLMSKEDLAKWNSDTVEKSKTNEKGYDGNVLDLENAKTKLGLTGNVTEIAGVYFAWQKEFPVEGATEGQPKTEWKYIDTNGNALGIQDPSDPNFAKQESMLGGLTETEEAGITFNTAALKGNYRIVELHELSTYKGKNGEALTDSKAVPVEITLPLVNETGIVADAHVYPKNTEDKPKIDKNFAKEVIDGKRDASTVEDKEALIAAGAVYDNYTKEKATISSRVGEKIPYDVKTKIPAKSHYGHMSWTDTLDPGLTFNQDVKITVTGAITALEEGDYTLKMTESSFTLTLTDKGLAKINDKAQDIEIQLNYSATINSSAIVDVPEKNEIRLNYGHKKKEESTPKPGNPVNQLIKVNKTWADGQAPTGVKVVYELWEKGASDDKDKLIAISKELSGNNLNYEFGTNVEDGANATKIKLDDNKTYYIKERVTGYDPEYVSFTEGTTTIKNKKSDGPDPLIPTSPKVVTYGKKFVKTDNKAKTAKDIQRLIGAEFVVMDSAKTNYLALKSQAQLGADETAYKAAQDKYDEEFNALKAELAKPESERQNVEQLKTNLENARIARDAAFKEARTGYEWVTDQSQALVLKSDDQGRFEITGLKEGTYYLKEITPPEGYAKRAETDLEEFKVAAGTYAGAETEMQYNLANADAGYGQQIKNKKVSIPQTGGIGTVIFTVAGLAIMATAALSLRKKKSERA